MKNRDTIETEKKLEKIETPRKIQKKTVTLKNRVKGSSGKGGHIVHNPGYRTGIFYLKGGHILHNPGYRTAIFYL